MKYRLVDWLASVIHAAYRPEKLVSNHSHWHTVNGKPYDLRKPWHELEEHHKEFDRAIARRLLSFDFWFR